MPRSLALILALGVWVPVPACTSPENADVDVLGSDAPSPPDTVANAPRDRDASTDAPEETTEAPEGTTEAPEETDEITEAPEETASRSIPGVLLAADAESGLAGYLADAELSAADLQLRGAWYTYDDVADCPASERPRNGLIEPTMGTTFVMTQYAQVQVEPPPEDSSDPNEWAIRFWGGNYTKWGAGAGISFNNPNGVLQPYDLAAAGFTGLRFWARSSQALPLQVKIQDKYSEASAPTVECCYLDKSVCGDNLCGVTEVQGCMAAPDYVVDLTPEWQKFELPFSAFVRPNWGSYVDGMSHNEPLVLSEAYQVQFEVSAGYTFDVFIDNVGFLLGATSNP